jgi:protein TonB
MQRTKAEDNIWPDLTADPAWPGGAPTPGTLTRPWTALYWSLSCAVHLLLLVAVGLLTRHLVEIPLTPPIRVSVVPTLETNAWLTPAEELNAVPQSRMPERRTLDTAAVASAPPMEPDALPTVTPPAAARTPAPRLPHTAPARELPKRGRPSTTFDDVPVARIPPIAEGERELRSGTTPGPPAKEQAGPQATLPQSTAARYGQNPVPPYPSEARRRGWEGTVLLMVEILESGRPERITIKESSGHSVLDEAALGAVERWTFVPAQRDGKPVRSVAEVPIVFSLRVRR